MLFKFFFAKVIFWKDFYLKTKPEIGPLGEANPGGGDAVTALFVRCSLSRARCACSSNPAYLEHENLILCVSAQSVVGRGSCLCYERR